jgi:hypothetical protein
MCLQARSAEPQAAAAQPVADLRLEVARFTADGQLLRPNDLDQWVFLGTSLGMGYNQGTFNPQSPGQFQVVLIEPRAYRYFVEHGHYAPGSMLLLYFYDTAQRRSINQTGFVQGELTNYEIHLIDPARSSEGRVFYVFRRDDAQGNAMPKGSACVACHTKHGAFEGTFAQFYPTIRDRIPKDALERALQDTDIR